MRLRLLGPKLYDCVLVKRCRVVLAARSILLKALSEKNHHQGYDGSNVGDLA